MQEPNVFKMLFFEKKTDTTDTPMTPNSNQKRLTYNDNYVFFTLILV